MRGEGEYHIWVRMEVRGFELQHRCRRNHGVLVYKLGRAQLHGQTTWWVVPPLLRYPNCNLQLTTPGISHPPGKISIPPQGSEGSMYVGSATCVDMGKLKLAGEEGVGHDLDLNLSLRLN